MSLENINAAAAAQTALTEAVNGKITQIDARVAAKEAQVDAFIKDGVDAFRRGAKIIFDPSILHTKQSLPLIADPNDNSKSQWIAMQFAHALNPTYIYTSEAQRAYLSVARNLSIGGTGNDYSRSVAEYCMANHTATNTQINQKIDQDGLDVSFPFAGATISITKQIPILQFAGLHPYTTLFMRIVNIATAGPPQPILTNGGTIHCAINDVTIYS